MALGSKKDWDWQRWGEQDPYYAVLTDARYSKANLTSDSLQEFFASGERHVERVYEIIRTKIKPGFDPDRVLDFGCGTGRLVIPFAARAKSVIGIDVSPAMLKEAGANCAKRGLSNAQFLHVDEIESLPDSSFDLIHSFIVLQHIPVRQGEAFVKKLVALMPEGGVGALHFTYFNTRSALRRFPWAFRIFPRLAGGVLNLVQHQPFNTPRMQMNSYSMNRIFDILFRARCSNLHIELVSHGTHHGAMLYFEKQTKPLE